MFRASEKQLVGQNVSLLMPSPHAELVSFTLVFLPLVCSMTVIFARSWPVAMQKLSAKAGNSSQDGATANFLPLIFRLWS